MPMPRCRVSLTGSAGPCPPVWPGLPGQAVGVGRVRNERPSQILGATFHATLMRTTRTAEGVAVYRTEDLPLARDRAPALDRSWIILHRLETTSPLHGQTPESLAACD